MGKKKHRKDEKFYQPKKIIKINDTNSNNRVHPYLSNVSSNAPENSPPMEIPGFYYDSEKNRYFKILPNKTFGSDHPHSISAIKEKKMTKEVEKSWAHRNYNRFDYLLSKEVNPFKSHRRIQNETGEFIVNLYHHVGSLETSYVKHRVTYFLIHPLVNDIYYGNVQGLVGLLRYRADKDSCSELFKLSSGYCTSEISSMDLTKDNLLSVTSLGGDLGPGVLCIFKIPADYNQFCLAEPVFEYVSKTTLWTSTFSQVTPSTAVGSSNNVTIVQNYSGHKTMERVYRTNSDVFALDFDRNQASKYFKPSVVYAGCRDGQIRIFDIRSNINRSAGESPRIRQSSPVCNLKSIHSCHVLCDGMNGSLSLWDIRCMKKDPVMEYLGHVNNGNRRIGFSVNTHESIVAIAGSDRYVRLYSISSGKLVRAPIGPFKEHISTIKFCETFSVADSSNLKYMEARDIRGEGIWFSVGSELQWWSV
ncbi:4717_t:CDS:10 [Acaulospora morrowiae]|uniref:4717_t:CDS:1 n=1 Tax=Acaulospora morrowiae TaxID=94023 RepID=A0A9N9AWV8_9GLOM|nr:4717_t:CDS:10 [Acaulospora morrowiae]